MMKTLTLAIFLSASFLLVFPAGAQDMSEAPTGQATATTTRAAAPSLYNSGVGPINMRPNAYIAHNATEKKDDARAAGSKSYPIKTTTTQAYNQRLQRARADQVRNSAGGGIPSPFPPGW